ncbi:MAG TPA: RidA family protein [Phycisphaerae bacterium]|nr:RidA family protein [Phycisphaerae bacterium]
MNSIEENLQKMGLVLPPAPKPVASYVTAVNTGQLVFISGQLPSREGKVVYLGKVPNPVSVEQAKEAAKLAAVNALAVLKDVIDGHWDRLVRIVRVGVFVQCDPAFEQHSLVANGASDLLAAVCGEIGRHARTTIGVAALPLNAAVEVELLAQVK